MDGDCSPPVAVHEVVLHARRRRRRCRRASGPRSPPPRRSPTGVNATASALSTGWKATAVVTCRATGSSTSTSSTRATTSASSDSTVRPNVGWAAPGGHARRRLAGDGVRDPDGERDEGHEDDQRDHTPAANLIAAAGVMPPALIGRACVHVVGQATTRPRTPQAADRARDLAGSPHGGPPRTPSGALPDATTPSLSERLNSSALPPIPEYERDCWKRSPGPVSTPLLGSGVSREDAERHRHLLHRDRLRPVPGGPRRSPRSPSTPTRSSCSRPSTSSAPSTASASSGSTPSSSTRPAAHSADMGEQKYFEHNSPDGETWSSRIVRYGYTREGCSYWKAGENIYYGAGLYSSPVPGRQGVDGLPGPPRRHPHQGLPRHRRRAPSRPTTATATSTASCGSSRSTSGGGSRSRSRRQTEG